MTMTEERPEVRAGASPPDRRLQRRALIALLAVAALVGAYLVVDPSGSAQPVADGAGPHLGHESVVDPATSKELVAAGYVELPGPEIMFEYRPQDPPKPTVDADALRTEVRAVVAARGWDRVEAGERDGFEQLTDAADPEHRFNRANLDDGVILDPERPESLVYDVDTGDLLAVMFMVPSGTHGPGVINGKAAWHVHATGMCFGDDAMMPLSLPTSASCPADQQYAPWSSEMLHIWFVGDPFASKMHES